MIPSKFLLISVADKNPETCCLSCFKREIFTVIRRIVMFKAYNLAGALLKVCRGADNIW